MSIDTNIGSDCPDLLTNYQQIKFEIIEGRASQANRNKIVHFGDIYQEENSAAGLFTITDNTSVLGTLITFNHPCLVDASFVFKCGANTPCGILTNRRVDGATNPLETLANSLEKAGVGDTVLNTLAIAEGGLIRSHDSNNVAQGTANFKGKVSAGEFMWVHTPTTLNFTAGKGWAAGGAAPMMFKIAAIRTAV